MSVSTISPQEFYRQAEQGEMPELIDVRTPVEFQEVHSKFAKNLPLDELDPHAFAQSREKPDSPLYVICRTGGRAAQACQKLQDAGWENVVNIEGGTLAWEQAGLPVNRGKKVMSLDRQVRIAAGSLVVLGAIPALLGYPYFAALSAFVGAGLVFAGITDTCAMGTVLAKMPWNQISKGKHSCCST